jgi:hypothetical protein
LRKWTGLFVALTVTFAVCDAQQIGLSPSCGLLSSMKAGFTRLVFQMERPEQKAPQGVEMVRVSTPTFAARSQMDATPTGFEFTDFPCSPLRPASGLDLHGLRLNSCESTRAPPMDPPTFC